ncbi:MAG: SRPBCC family protein [Actinomycetota bacterium]|nr:SRPBCC family protein [Actinomycetota bacterium]MDQ5808054.1 SRPBCC family protein [Actinomycetota bacterium]
MDPITSSVLVDRPREEVYEYLSDIANHWEFTDHHLREVHMTREDTYGVGAGMRYRQPTPLNRFDWAELTITDMEPPRRIVEKGRGGKYNRIRSVAVWTLEPAHGGGTRVTLTYETQPRFPSDRLIEALGRRRVRRGQRKALKRLRSIMEEGRERGRRATIAAGGPRKPASQFRL